MKPLTDHRDHPGRKEERQMFDMGSWRMHLAAGKTYEVETHGDGSRSIYYVQNGIRVGLLRGDENGPYFDVGNNDRLRGLQITLEDFSFFSYYGYMECERRERGLYRWKTAEGELVYHQQHTKGPLEPWLVLTTTDVWDGVRLIGEIKAGRIRPAVSYERPQIESPAREFQEMLDQLKLVFVNWLNSRPAWIWLCAVGRWIGFSLQRAGQWLKRPICLRRKPRPAKKL